MKKIIFKNGVIVLVILSLVSMISCEKDTSDFIVNTLDANSITINSATCGGDILSDGDATITECGICWSQMGVPSISDDIANSTLKSGKYEVSMTNLIPGTQYFVRAYMTNKYGTFYGETKSFTTKYLPEVVNSEVESSWSSVYLNVTITSPSGDEIIERGVCWSSSSKPTIANNVEQNGSGTGTFTVYIDNSELEYGSTYYFRGYAKTADTVSYGNQVKFTR